MKWMRNISLRWRLTLMTGMVLILGTGLITGTSIYNAHSGFQTVIPAVPLSPAGEITEESDSKAELVERITVVQASRAFAGQSIAALTLVILIGMAVVYLMAEVALRPVRELSNQVRAVTAADLSTRLPDIGRRDEVGDLTVGFNHMLARLEQSFQRQQRFTASAAHELKTPLTVIKTGIQVLELDDAPTTEEYRELIDTVGQSVKRMIGVVEDLLRLASEEEIETEPIALQPLIESIMTELSANYAAQNISTEIECGACEVTGNAGLLSHVFANLLENAMKYNWRDGSLSVKAQHSENGTVVTIHDTGIGIPKLEQEKIFEPFYRVDQSRSRKVAGSGLGLSLARAILDQHGAAIFVESSDAYGSTFTVNFPT